jgi:very-short-patch-repair endonuclease
MAIKPRRFLAMKHGCGQRSPRAAPLHQAVRVLRRPLPHGVFLGSHAVADGAITRRQLQSGLFRRLVHNVYADPRLPLDHQLLCRAVALVMPPDAVIAGRSAACWFGAPFAGAADPVTVIVPALSTWRGPRGVRVHRTDLACDEVMVVDHDIRVTTPIRTAWDVATLERTPDAVATLDGMLRADAVDEPALARLQAGAPGRWRARRAQRALALADRRAQSPAESWVRVACRLADLPAPVPQFAVLDDDGNALGTVDLGWPEAKLVVEYEGAYHFDDVQIIRDDRRYERMVRAGWRVIRLSSADLRDLDGVVRRIRAALAS